jgi:hypothetical protein
VTANPDPDLWLLRDCIFDDKGAEVHMFWQAASTEGNALPGPVTFDATDPRFYQTHVFRNYPRSGALPAIADRVTMRVRLLPMGYDVLDDLVTSGDLDRSVRDAMKAVDVGEMLEWTPTATAVTVLDEETKLPLSCVTKTNFNVQASKVPAPEHVRCKP